MGGAGSGWRLIGFLQKHRQSTEACWRGPVSRHWAPLRSLDLQQPIRSTILSAPNDASIATAGMAGARIRMLLQ